MSPDQLAAIGALLSGIGAILGSVLAQHRYRSKAKSECEQRIQEIKKAFTFGTEYEKRRAREET